MGRHRDRLEATRQDRTDRDARRRKFERHPSAKLATVSVSDYVSSRDVPEAPNGGGPEWTPRLFRHPLRRVSPEAYEAGWDDGWESGWLERGLSTEPPNGPSEPSTAGALVLGRDVAQAALEGLLAALARGIGDAAARRAALTLEAALAGATRRRGGV